MARKGTGEVRNGETLTHQSKMSTLNRTGQTRGGRKSGGKKGGGWSDYRTEGLNK